MKKFLSLVLSLVMTMSLVTIGAGATDYDDLTDKGDIQYEEAVAVLNKLGIITGYEDGSFKPTGALTRGAAAKIIVSLMIGADAASSLTISAAPYSDVPVTNTFAAVISYCKTAGYINGYTDGTFRPTAALSGYAFSKMLLGALGYDGVQENFTGSGWTMNVARLSQTAGLYNDFDPAFSGTGSVDRQSACLLALNTLKATEVEYSGGTNITTTTGNATTNVATNKERSYKVSNNDKINKNINGEASGNQANYFTLEFGEDHFQDLKLENARTDHAILDDYGRPSNKWTYKNVEIGTYAKTADYTFTKAASGDTDNDKVKDMGLNSYDIAVSRTINNDSFTTTITVNGKELTAGTDFVDGDTNDGSTNAALLAGFVKNGTTVQVYLSDDASNVIAEIAVVETQLVKINRVTSSDVTFSVVEGSGVAGALNSVKDDDDCYAALKDLKADDYVVVTPLYDSGTTYDVDAVFVPTTVAGKISKVKVNSSNLATGLTISDTAYSMSFNWTVEDAGDPDGRVSQLNGSSVSTTRESTVYLDSFGYVIYVENVNSSTDNILFDEVYTNTVGGRNHYFAQGWDMKGNEVSLDLGSNSSYANGLTSGTVYAYTSTTNHSNADYEITGRVQSGTTTEKWLASKTNIGGTYFSNDVKYIFITWTNDGQDDVDTITVKDGAQEVSKDVKYQYVIDYNKPNTAADDEITAVILSDDTDVEVSKNVMYIQKETSTTTDSSNKIVSIVTAYIDGVKTTDVTLDKRVGSSSNSLVDGFYTYSKDESTGIYKVNSYTTSSGKSTSVLSNTFFNKEDLISKAYLSNTLYLDANVIDSTHIQYSVSDKLEKELNLHDAKVVDLRDGGTLNSAKDMANATDLLSYNVSLVFNDSDSSSAKGRVAYVFIKDAYSVAMVTDGVTMYSVAAPDGTLLSTDGTSWSDSIQTKGEVDSVFYIKPDGADFFFKADPTEHSSDLGGSAQFDAQTNGSYKVTLANAISANVADTAFATVDTAKLADAYLDEVTTPGTPELYLHFVDADGDQTSVTDKPTLANIAVTYLQDNGHPEAYIVGTSNPVVYYKNGNTLMNIADGGVKGDVKVIELNGNTKYVLGTDNVTTITGVASQTYLYVKQIEGSTTSFVATDGDAAKIVDGAKYTTNGTAGYVKLASADMDVSGSTILSSNTVTIETDGLEKAGSDKFVAVGENFTVQVKVADAVASADVTQLITIADNTSIGADVAIVTPASPYTLIAASTAIIAGQTYDVTLTATSATADLALKLALTNS